MMLRYKNVYDAVVIDKRGKKKIGNPLRTHAQVDATKCKEEEMGTQIREEGSSH